uniref:Uncharacterized protein n=1 Tax=Arundo donax TaxID=35708 RepID=A0A0A8ZBK0_ARUDO
MPLCSCYDLVMIFASQILLFCCYIWCSVICLLDLYL